MGGGETPTPPMLPPLENGATYISNEAGNELEIPNDGYNVIINSEWRQRAHIDEWEPPYYLFIVTDIAAGWSFDDVSGALRPSEITYVADAGLFLTFGDCEISGEVVIHNHNYSGCYKLIGE